MTNRNNFTANPIDKASLTRHLLIGAMVGFAAISFFVFGVDNPDPDWGSFWRVKPLVITPLSGAAGGAVFYVMGYVAAQRGWNKALALVASFLIAFVGLWMGIILGLNGTMWD